MSLTGKSADIYIAHSPLATQNTCENVASDLGLGRRFCQVVWVFFTNS